MIYFKVLKKIIGDELFRAGYLILIALIITSVFFYIYHILVGRILGTAKYGEFGALFSLAFFLHFILSRSLNIMVARSISKYKGKNNLQIIPLFLSKMLLCVFILGFVAFLIFLLFSVQIADFLHIDSIILVLLVGIIFLLTWLQPVNIGIMQGLQRFNHVAIMNVIPAMSKALISIGLVLLGFGIYGAMEGIVIGTIISLIVSFYLIRDVINWPGSKISSRTLSTTIPKNKLNPEVTNISTQDIYLEIKNAFRFSFPVLFVVVCLAIPTNIDVILVKHFFTTYNASLFTAVSVFGRMIFALPMAITLVMYPKAVEALTKKIDPRSLLNRSMFYTSLPAGLLTVLIYTFPEFFLGVLYGKEYLVAEPLLRYYVIFIFFFSLSTVLVFNSLAKNRYGFVYIFGILSILSLGFVWLYHGSLILIIQILLAISLASFIIGFSMNYLSSDINKI